MFETGQSLSLNKIQVLFLRKSFNLHKWLLFWFSGAVFFKLVHLYLGDSLEMKGYLGIMLRLCAVTVDSFLVLKCMSMCAT